MSGERVERRLAAILAADVAGYSRLMGQDEAGTLARLRTHRRELIDPKISEHKGRIVKTTGDGLLVEFPSVVEAVACAVAVQRGMAERNAATSGDQRIVFRVGINLGDLIVEEGDIHGDGVNVAARLEALAESGGICVSGTVRDHIGDRLDVIFDDLGDQTLKNIARPVRVFRVRIGEPATTGAKSAPPPPTLSLPDKPSIAVLPFQNMSGDPEQEYFADGMVEEIITALSRINWLFVIARNSSFIYKGRAIEITQVGRELGVRYVLEGSVRKGGNRVRITAQLIEAKTGAHLWADRFDGSLDDIFELQDKVAVNVAGVIEPTLVIAETRRSGLNPTNDMSAYDLYLRAFELGRSWEPASIIRARDLLDQAIARDPNYGAALGLAANCYVMLGVTTGAENDRKEAINLAQRAIRSGAYDPVALALAAHVLGNLDDDINGAIALIDRALEMNPSYAIGWYYSGWLRLWAGRTEIAMVHFEKASRLSPYEMPARVLLGMGICKFFARDFDDARSTLRRALQEFPRWPPTYRFLAACCAHMGRLDEAHEVVDQLRSTTSAIVPNASHWRDAEHRELFLSGLRLASGEAA